ncbi:MAG: ABC transporter ATP-binding protein [Candidatus Rokuibacteriota bacterium]
MLAIRGLTVDIQASRILHDVRLEVGERELACLVGRNGAGKTTTLRTVMGYLRPTAGTIVFKGRSLVGLPTHTIAALGVGFSPEESEIFGNLTVAENIELATWVRQTGRPAAERIERAYGVFPGLRRYAARGGTQLSGGERKMLSVARALALDPELLLLDEPFEGLAPAIVPAISASIAEITRLGHSILLAESNIHHVPEHTNRVYVIERGEIIFQGTRDEVQHDQVALSVIGGSV